LLSYTEEIVVASSRQRGSINSVEVNLAFSGSHASVRQGPKGPPIKKYIWSSNWKCCPLDICYAMINLDTTSHAPHIVLRTNVQ
jgi:hypothetical protein